MSVVETETVAVEDLPDLEVVHMVCCVDQPDMRTFCGQTLDDEEEDVVDVLTCPECIEVEEAKGVGGCPRFNVCALYKEA